jgi:hypothetical protein
VNVPNSKPRLLKKNFFGAGTASSRGKDRRLGACVKAPCKAARCWLAAAVLLRISSGSAGHGWSHSPEKVECNWIDGTHWVRCECCCYRVPRSAAVMGPVLAAHRKRVGVSNPTTFFLCRTKGATAAPPAQPPGGGGVAPVCLYTQHARRAPGHTGTGPPSCEGQKLSKHNGLYE